MDERLLCFIVGHRASWNWKRAEKEREKERKKKRKYKGGKKRVKRRCWTT